MSLRRHVIIPTFHVCETQPPFFVFSFFSFWPHPPLPSRAGAHVHILWDAERPHTMHIIICNSSQMGDHSASSTGCMIQFWCTEPLHPTPMHTPHRKHGCVNGQFFFLKERHGRDLSRGRQLPRAPAPLSTGDNTWAEVCLVNHMNNGKSRFLCRYWNAGVQLVRILLHCLWLHENRLTVR